MPKPMFVWSGSAWVSVATEVESLANYATVNYASTQPGMKMVVPTSVAVGSGSGSVDTNGAVTFSGSSSVTLNGVFSSTYDNYLITLTGGAGSANQLTLRLQLGSSTASYNSTLLYSLYTSGSPAKTGDNNGSVWNYVGGVNADTTFAEIYLSNPFAAKYTSFRAPFATDDAAGSNSGIHKVASSYSSCILSVASGTFSGTIRVYGLKN